MSELVDLLRGAETVCGAAFVGALLYVMRGRGDSARVTAAWALPMFVLGVLVSYGPTPREWLFSSLPIGIGLGFVAVFVLLRRDDVRLALSSLSDGEVRHLLAYRAVFGMFLVGAALGGAMPPDFAWTAGVGDLAVGALATAMPVSLGPEGPPWARRFVHGVGFLDLCSVGVAIPTIALPWLRATPSALGPVLILPWVLVPLMGMLNLHGILALAPRPAAPA